MDKKKPVVIGSCRNPYRLITSTGFRKSSVSDALNIVVWKIRQHFRVKFIWPNATTNCLLISASEIIRMNCNLLSEMEVLREVSFHETLIQQPNQRSTWIFQFMEIGFLKWLRILDQTDTSRGVPWGKTGYHGGATSVVGSPKPLWLSQFIMRPFHHFRLVWSDCRGIWSLRVYNQNWTRLVGGTNWCLSRSQLLHTFAPCHSLTVPSSLPALSCPCGKRRGK